MVLSPLFFSTLNAMKRNDTSVLPSQQRLHKLRFLQKQGCQKPCWDQVRLSRLVNKQVGQEVELVRKEYGGVEGGGENRDICWSLFYHDGLFYSLIFCQRAEMAKPKKVASRLEDSRSHSVADGKYTDGQFVFLSRL